MSRVPLLLALALAVCWRPSVAAAQGILILDDSSASNPSEIAGQRLALPTTTTRNVASFILEADNGVTWDAIILDLSRLVLTPPAELLIEEHVAAGGTLVVAADGLAALTGLQSVLGLSCGANVSGTAIYEAASEGATSVFEAGDSVRSPLRLASFARANCAPEDAEVFARFGDSAESPAAIFRLSSSVVVLGFSLSRIADTLDADADGIADAVELVTNVLETSLSAQRAGIAAVVNGDRTGVQQWANDESASITFFDSIDELLEADSARTTAILISDPALAAADLAVLDEYSDLGVPIVVFSAGWASATAWLERWSLELSADPATGALDNAGGGLGAQLFSSVPLAIGIVPTPSPAFALASPWYALAARDDGAVIAINAERGRVASTVPLEAFGIAEQPALLSAAFALAEDIARTVSVVTSRPDTWVLAITGSGRLPIVISPDAEDIGEAVLDGPVDAVVFDLRESDVTETGFEADLLQAAQRGDFGLIVQQQGTQPGWPAAFGVTTGDESFDEVELTRDATQLTGVFKLPQATPSALFVRGGARPLADAGGRVVIARVEGAPALVGDPSGRALFGVTPSSTTVDSDSDRDQRFDDAELAAGMLHAVLSPQRALVAGDGPERLLQMAAEATGLVAVPATASDERLRSEEYAYALWQSTGDGVLTPESTASVLARVAAALPTVMFVTDADDAPEFTGALNVAAQDPATAGPLVEPFESALNIFRTPRFVPSPLSVVGPVVGDPGDQLIGGEGSLALAVYNVNVGPAASLVDGSSAWLINGWDPSLRGDADLDSDGLADVSELIANELLVVGRAPVGRIEGPSVVAEGARFLLDATSSYDRNDAALTFAWELTGDGQFDDDSGPIVLFDATAVDGPSLGSVQLRVTNEDGISSLASFEFSVTNAPPRILNAGTIRVQEGTAAMLSVDVVDIATDDVTVRWVFDDGFEADGATIVREFDELGSYTALVTATDDDGGEDSVTVRVEYVNAAPSIALGEVPEAVDEGTAIHFEAFVDDGTDSPEVRWRFGDGEEAVGPSVTHTYADDGIYLALATATDSLGAVSSASVRLTVTNVAPTLTSTPPTTVDGFGQYVYAAAVVDPGADVLRYELEVHPEGMVVSQDGVVTWTPSLGALEDAAVTLVVLDGDGGRAEQSWVVTITATDTDMGGAPDVCEARFGGDINDREDDASDDDGDGLTLAQECLRGSDPTVFSGPGVPNPVSPNDAVSEFRFTTVLTFENTTDPDGDRVLYEVELARDSLMQEVLFADSDIAPTGRVQTRVEVPGTLDEDRRYFWRVRATTFDVTGEWSEVVAFRINRTNRAPGRPTLVAPLDFADSRRPTLIWRNSSDPDGDRFTYELEVYDSSLNGTRVWRLENLVPSEQESQATPNFALEDGNDYVWRVRAIDASPPYPIGQWSEVAEFVVDTSNLAPPRPELVLPAADALVSLSNEVRLQWTQGLDPNGDDITARLELATDEEFSNVVFEYSGAIVRDVDTQDVDVSEHVELETAYWWRVEATDGRASSGFSTSTFTVLPANRPPTAPTSVAPSPGETVADAGQGVTLTVDNATDPDPFDNLTYEFQIATAVTMSGTVARPVDVLPGPAGQTSITLNDLSAGQYFWRARAFDGLRQSQWTEVRAFIVTVPRDADAGGDAAPNLDAGDAGDDESGRRGGGGCAAATPVSWGAWLWWSLTIGGTALRSRRRRPMHAPPNTARRRKSDHHRN